MNLRPTKATSQFEFIILVALLSSLIALSTDAMLPAMPEISRDLGLADVNRVQLIISVFILGTGVGQLFFGPLADYKGRKTAISTGLLIFIAGSVICIYSESFTVMLIGRLIQGLGVAGPRTASVAMVRDLYSGRDMARVMSFVMGVFILVPAVAPAVGQGVIYLSGWREIFLVFILLAVIAFVWLGLRQPETNPVENRSPFSFANLIAAAKSVFSNRATMLYTGAAGLIFGSFVAYLGTAQQIFTEVFGVGEKFPAYFAAMALSIGAASFFNAKLVMNYGMRAVCRTAFLSVAGISTTYFVLVLLVPAAQNLTMFMIWGMASFFCVGMVFGNLNSLAMEPMGKVAGVAAALIGFGSTLISVAVGTPVGQLYSGNILPLIGAFALFTSISFMLLLLAGRVRQDPSQ
ncbi:MAG: multidrug effflux MFS transporter [Rhodobacteraceae bacterium]|nr:multidrug effflux MFS transporter [Paracoccaceae bacterium]